MQDSLSSLEAFVKYDYAETKDLCLHFITLASGLLVFSITFSDKIVQFEKARTIEKLLLLSCWGLFLCSIVVCGLGLGLVTCALSTALYGDSPVRYFLGHNPRAQSLEFWAANAVLLAAILLVIGLLMMLGTGVSAVFRRPQTVARTTGVVPPPSSSFE